MRNLNRIIAINTLKNIEDISDKLLKIKNVASVTSILNVPILLSPPRPITELIENIPTIESDNM